MAGRGVKTDFIEVDGETRLNTLIIDESDHSLSTITVSTLRVGPDHIRALLERCDELLDQAKVLVTGGTLPTGMQPDFYRTLIEMAHAHAVPVAFDASQPFLAAGLAAHPEYCKPNRDELSALFGRPIVSIRDAYEAGQEVIARYGSLPVITLGADGALAVLRDRAYYIPPLSVNVVSPAGAGDCVLAGIAASIAAGDPIESGLRMGIAAATATLLQPATADLDPADYQKFYPQVVLTNYP
jgi:1-phosphofructokinase family hexose kinase